MGKLVDEVSNRYMFEKGMDLIKMVVEDSGNLDIVSDLNLI